MKKLYFVAMVAITLLALTTPVSAQIPQRMLDNLQYSVTGPLIDGYNRGFGRYNPIIGYNRYGYGNRYGYNYGYGYGGRGLTIIGGGNDIETPGKCVERMTKAFKKNKMVINSTAILAACSNNVPPPPPEDTSSLETRVAFEEQSSSQPPVQVVTTRRQPERTYGTLPQGI